MKKTTKIKEQTHFLLLLLGAAILLLGTVGLYLSKKETTPTSTDPQILKLEKQGWSNDIPSIETDLKNTDFSEIDAELKEIENSL